MQQYLLLLLSVCLTTTVLATPGEADTLIGTQSGKMFLCSELLRAGAS